MNRIKLLFSLAGFLFLSTTAHGQGMPSWIQSNSSAASSWLFGSSGSDGANGERSFALATFNNATYFVALNQRTLQSGKEVSLRVYSSDPQAGTDAQPAMIIPLAIEADDGFWPKIDANGSLIAATYVTKDYVSSHWRAKAFTYDLATQTLTQILDRDTGINISAPFSSIAYWIFVNQAGSRVVLVEQLMSGKKLIIKQNGQSGISEWTFPVGGNFVASGRYRMAKNGSSLLFMGQASSIMISVIDLNNLLNGGSFAASVKNIDWFPANAKADLSANGQVLAVYFTGYSGSIYYPMVSVYRKTATGYVTLYSSPKIILSPSFSVATHGMISVSPDGRQLALSSRGATTTTSGASTDFSSLTILNTRNGEVRYQREFMYLSFIMDMDFAANGRFAYGMINASGDYTVPTLIGLQIYPDSVSELFSTIPYPGLSQNVISLDLSPNGDYFGVGYSNHNTGGLGNILAGYGMGMM